MKFKDTDEYFSKINQYFHLILVTPLTLYCFIYLNNGGAGGWDSLFENEVYTQIALYFFGICSSVLIAYSFKSFSDQIKKGLTERLSEKLELYYSAFLTQQVLLTTGGFIAIIGLYITGYHIFSILYLISLFASSTQRPSSHRVVKVLRLKDEERQIILKKKAIPE